MTAYAEQRGDWMVFWTEPLCFLVYRQCGNYPVPQWELKAFVEDEARKAREWIKAGGGPTPAW